MESINDFFEIFHRTFFYTSTKEEYISIIAFFTGVIIDIETGGTGLNLNDLFFNIK
jgi:hypothetical protein